MSESKHTPGPWVVGRWHGRCRKSSHQPSRHPGPHGSDPCVYDYTLATDGADDCCVSLADPEKHEDLISWDADGTVLSNPADASLIAAAPDLLSALRSLLSEWDALGYGDDEGNPIPDQAPCAQKARAAIAKAEGK